MNVNSIRSLVRPAVTLCLVGGFVVGAFANASAAEILKDLTVAVVAFWFGQRNGPTTPS
ncbi:MAG: hypothetical protein RLZZ200_2626 [Pseudomonadota bacterium]|jgi:4-hydroxybenzoate polyprenyltransferase